MTFATAVHILFTSFVYRTNVYWSVIHGIKRKPHLLVEWSWYHFVAIANLHQPRHTDLADINTWLQLSDTNSVPPMHGGFLLVSRSHFDKNGCCIFISNRPTALTGRGYRYRCNINGASISTNAVVAFLTWFVFIFQSCFTVTVSTIRLFWFK